VSRYLVGETCQQNTCGTTGGPESVEMVPVAMGAEAVRCNRGALGKEEREVGMENEQQKRRRVSLVETRVYLVHPLKLDGAWLC